MRGQYLGELEELVLLTIALITEQAYGVNVTQELERQTGRQIDFSTIHTTLKRFGSIPFSVQRNMSSQQKGLHIPPRWAVRLLKWNCPADSLEEVQGDLQELYAHWVETVGEKEARRRFVLNAIRLQRPFTSNERKGSHSSVRFRDMIQHYGIVAFRNVLRNKSFSIINLTGLALGLACSLLIFLWVLDERRVDNFHANSKQLYRVYVRYYNNGVVTGAEYNTPAPLPAELKKVIPEVEHATGYVKYFRLSLQDDIYETFQVEDKIHKLKGSRAEEDFFKMFDYTLLYGSPEKALASPASLCMSRKMAELYFGSAEAAMGKTVRFDGRKDLVVTAVFENLSVHSTDQFDYLMNWDAWVAENPFKQQWRHFGTSTYVQLRQDDDPLKVEAKIRGFLSTYLEGMNVENRIELGLQPFGDQYLHSQFEQGKPSGGRIEYIRIFSAVGMFILLIACINFMNLATARSVKRGKEVGIRKVVGSSRNYLITQFLGEAMLFTFLAVLFSLVLIGLALPAFNDLTGKQISLPIQEPYFYLFLTGLILVTGFIAGSYPALFLSSLQSFKFNSGAAYFRKGLVVVQFVLSLILLTATLVISRQTDYILHTNLGYDREDLLYIPLEGDLVAVYSLFREEASKMPGIKMVDRSSQFPHAMSFKMPAVEWAGMNRNVNINFALASVGYDFVNLMNLKMAAGRGFSREMKTDSISFVVNEEAIKQMGLNGPLGTQITVFGKTGPIIGILKDYHTNSLRQAIDPLVLDVKEHLNFGTILVRTQRGETNVALQSLEKVYKHLNPNYPFLYSFLDEQYGKLYKSEQTVNKLSYAFALLAIVISCLGLLGLAMFSVEQRRKEMGIRKILGATVSNLVSKFSIEFLRLVFLSLIIAVPLSWWTMKIWLENFAYRIDLAWWIFAQAGLVALLISMLTISTQAMAAALENPIESLRTE